MKTSLKTFAYAFAISFALFACDTGTNNTEQPLEPATNEVPNPACKQSMAVVDIPYDELGLDPSCKDEKRKRVIIFDLTLYSNQLEEYTLTGGCVDEICGHVLNGKVITQEEYEDFMADRSRKISELEAESWNKLSIPCLITKEGFGSRQALLTEEEIAELKKVRGDLIVENYIQAIPTTACDTSANSTNIPIMHNKVASYQRAFTSECYAGLRDVERYDLISDENILKSCFPNAFEKEQSGKCNYFAINLPAPSSSFSGYMILSQDLVLYRLTYNPDISVGCGGSSDFAYEAMLICDDEIGTLKNKMNFDSFQSYIVPDWNCNNGETFPQRTFF